MEYNLFRLRRVLLVLFSQYGLPKLLNQISSQTKYYTLTPAHSCSEHTHTIWSE